MLAVQGARRGELRRSVDRPRIRRVFGETGSGGVAFIVGPHIIIAIGGVLRNEEKNFVRFVYNYTLALDQQSSMFFLNVIQACGVIQMEDQQALLSTVVSSNL